LNKINWVILLCVLASVWLWNSDPDVAIEYFAFSGDNLLKGRAWTLITALFLHVDLSHLLGNMIFLFVFGNTLEREVHAQKTLGVFLLGGVLSFLLSVFFYDPAIPLIGASAAIFTLVAIVMLVKPLKFSFLFLMPQGLVAIIYLLYNLTAVYYGVAGNVAYISHIIGFSVGIPFGIAWSKDWVKNLLITIALFILYIVIIYFIQTMLAP
jgi:membrane associated rhomboid family serine protease